MGLLRVCGVVGLYPMYPCNAFWGPLLLPSCVREHFGALLGVSALGAQMVALLRAAVLQPRYPRESQIYIYESKHSSIDLQWPPKRLNIALEAGNSTWLPFPLRPPSLPLSLPLPLALPAFARQDEYSSIREHLPRTGSFLWQ